MTTSHVSRFAVWEGPGQRIRVRTGPLPAALPPGHALARITLATVCGSDWHTMLGHRTALRPSILGHEQIGVIEAIGGPGPSRDDGTLVQPGDRVVWSVTASCRTCAPCRAGYDEKCQRLFKYGHEQLRENHPLSGGFASHCLIRPGTVIVKAPDGVPDAVLAPASCATATVAEILRVARHGRTRRGSSGLAGARVLVTGAGLLGLTATAMAAQAGADIVVVEPDARRRALARQFGATTTMVPGERLRDIDVAIELSGAPAAVETCLAALAIGGHAILAGSVSPSSPAHLDPERIVRGLHQITGVHNYPRTALLAAVTFLTAHHRTYPFASLVAEPIPLTELGAALAKGPVSELTPRLAVLP